MSQAEVLDIERSTENGAQVVNIKADLGGGDNLTLDHFANAGDDSLPLPGDVAAISPGAGTGVEQTTGYLDTKNEGKALPGEKRQYARDASGNVVGEIWLHGNGDIEILSLASGGKIILNGVEIDQQGNIKTPGEIKADLEVSAMNAAAPVKLSTHLHPTAVGPTSPPTPGS